MKYHVITLPFEAGRGQFALREWEEFCNTHHVLECQAHFFHLHKQCYWTCWVGYEPKRSPTPQTPEPLQLSSQQEELYEALKAWRKERAHRDGITSFLIAKNAELQQIALQQPHTASGLLGISGFGKKKVAKYAEEILSLIDQHSPKPSTP